MATALFEGIAKAMAEKIAAILPEGVPKTIAKIFPEPDPVYSVNTRTNNVPRKLQKYKEQCLTVWLCRIVLMCLFLGVLLLVFYGCSSTTAVIERRTCTTEDDKYAVNKEEDFPVTCKAAFAIESVMLFVHKCMLETSQRVVSNFCHGVFKEMCQTLMTPIVKYLESEERKSDIKTWSRTAVHGIANEVMKMLAKNCPFLKPSWQLFVQRETTNTLALIKEERAKNDQKLEEISKKYTKNNQKLQEIMTMWAEMTKVRTSIKKKLAELRKEREELGSC